MVDIDRFKAYSDHAGHPTGDECLRKVARALTGSFRRAGETVARYGGEEFAMIVPHATLAQLVQSADRARAAVEEAGIPHPTSDVAPVVTISAGVACCVPGRGDASRLVELADAALYRAKRAGRNCVMGPP